MANLSQMKRQRMLDFLTQMQAACSDSGASYAALQEIKEELAAVAEALVSGADLRADPRTAKHADWAEEFRSRYTITRDNALDIVEKETGLVFAQVLEDAGVYARTPEGQQAFLRFLQQV